MIEKKEIEPVCVREREKKIEPKWEREKIYNQSKRERDNHCKLDREKERTKVKERVRELDN